jgi:hypothetical protein
MSSAAEKAVKAATATTTTLPGRGPAPTAQSNNGTGYSSELNKMLSANGVTATTDTAPAASTDDPPVLVRTPHYSGSSMTDQPQKISVSTLQKQFYSMNEDQLKKLQKRLYDGGFYDDNVTEKDIAYGAHDDDSFDAYTKALKRAANYLQADNEVSFDEVVDDAAKHRAVNAGKSKTVKEPFLPVISDTQTLKDTVKKVSTIVAGQYLPDSVLDQIWQDYQAQEYNNAATKYQAGQTGNAAVLTEMPAFQDFAASEVREKDPTKAGAQDLASRASVFQKLLDDNRSS